MAVPVVYGSHLGLLFRSALCVLLCVRFHFRAWNRVRVGLLRAEQHQYGETYQRRAGGMACRRDFRAFAVWRGDVLFRQSRRARLGICDARMGGADIGTDTFRYIYIYICAFGRIEEEARKREVLDYGVTVG